MKGGIHDFNIFAVQDDKFGGISDQHFNFLRGNKVQGGEIWMDKKVIVEGNDPVGKP